MAILAPNSRFLLYAALAIALIAPHALGSEESDDGHRSSTNSTGDDDEHSEHSDPAASLTVLVIALGAGIFSAVPLKDYGLPYVTTPPPQRTNRRTTALECSHDRCRQSTTVTKHEEDRRAAAACPCFCSIRCTRPHRPEPPVRNKPIRSLTDLD